MWHGLSLTPIYHKSPAKQAVCSSARDVARDFLARTLILSALLTAPWRPVVRSRDSVNKAKLTTATEPASSAAPSTPSRTSARRSLGPAAAAAVAKTTKAKRPNGSAIAEDTEMADADGLPSRPAKRARGSMASTAGARVSRARSVFQAVVNQIPAIPGTLLSYAIATS